MRHCVRGRHRIPQLRRAAGKPPLAQLAIGAKTGTAGDAVEIGEDVPAAAYVQLCTELPALGRAASSLVAAETPEDIASAVELVLEGLHLSKHLNKDAIGGRAQYRSRG